VARPPYDPTIYRGCASYYARGRPPYSRIMAETLTAELGLDRSGRLLDIGCGPGILTTDLSPRFAEAIGLEPDPEMLAEAERRAAREGLANIRWVEALAEDIPELDLGKFQLVTFGQSFHWTDRATVAESVHDLLEPGGALALITHAKEGRPQPDGPGPPPIPHDTIRALIDRYLGPRRRAGQGFSPQHGERFEVTLARTRFGSSRAILCPGRPDIIRDIDGVLAGYHSTSFAAPHLFGNDLSRFNADVRAELAARSATGLFWDWPGDTEILLARKAA
jgi:SAM-dependent methyltransferase